ncbi:NADH oxidase [Syntrophotalea carbinolica DSM 2380]|uniref:NADH oxidase n=1 Tax=Syntrophotalea carbinolica (strain DSM 2380 / NBRC 103641 / GraBd1) TaxID=338963 RepID=Q3A2J3_SYNC1|nr:NAD(P)/FAD-dependent oxidoreductase [Syntrophotalea carbinolica]ABA89414.1 NADH oxidase [Syntrophotalea carbinolica DSM 2380]
MKNYPNIFEPLTVKRMTIKNRIVMPPIGTNLAGLDGKFNTEHIAYYVQRAKGGTGLITVENACLDFPLGTNGTTQLRIDNDQYIPGLYKLTEALHAYGACVSIQLNHAGASAYPGRLNGMQQVSSSNIPSKTGGSVPRSLTKDEIYAIVRKFGEAAGRAQRAEFDCVEIHAGHSYLLSQFLSPIYNKRTDEFGGSPENRARFARLVIDEVRSVVGPFFPIGLRFSADEFMEGGNTLEDTLRNLEYLSEGVDIFNVSAALNDTLQFQIDEMNLADGWRSYMAKAVREKFGKVTITSGNIRDPRVAEKILADGEADLIAMGRGLIADPNWVEKVEHGHEHLLRKCISCNIGCADHRIAKSEPIRCTINPDVVSEDAYKQKQVKHPMNVVVIGGGTAGLEAACTAAEVGCDVHLFESKDYLGGLAREIARLPDKNRINDFPDYLIERAKTLDNLHIATGTKADVKTIDALQPDIVVNATGAKPLLPPIKGLHEEMGRENSKVFSIFDLLGDMDRWNDMVGKNIAVIGGGAVGLDVVEFFVKRGAAKVSIVEMMPMLGKDLDLITRLSMMNMVKEYGVEVHTNTALTEIAADHFKLKHAGVDADMPFAGAEFDLPFDYGFVCLGMRADQSLWPDLLSYKRETGVEVVNIGDGKIARRIINGTKEGRDILTTIAKVDQAKDKYTPRAAND